MIAVRKTYVDGPYGQIHARLTPPVAGAAPLVCLHATAYSSQSFLPLMQALGQKRQVIAIDMPGYGESDAPPQPIAMSGYAQSALTAIDVLVDGPATLLGYHTGCYAATEMAIAQPTKIDRIVLIGVPYFQALDFDTWKAKLSARHHLTDDLDQFAERWSYFITSRHPEVTLRRGFANFIDELKAWPNGWWAHDAMFAYDSDARLPLIKQPVLILNPSGHLAPASRIAGSLIRRCSIQDMSDLSGPVLETVPDRLAVEIAAWTPLETLDH